MCVTKNCPDALLNVVLLILRLHKRHMYRGGPALKGLLSESITHGHRFNCSPASSACRGRRNMESAPENEHVRSFSFTSVLLQNANDSPVPQGCCSLPRSLPGIRHRRGEEPPAIVMLAPTISTWSIFRGVHLSNIASGSV